MRTCNIARLLSFFVLLCTFTKGSGQSTAVSTTSLELFDSARQRAVPVFLYMPPAAARKQHPKLVVINHGYNENRPGTYKNYSFIAEGLALKGYFVASIQHELPGDSLIPTTGIPQVVRRPFWERGTQNILFAVHRLALLFPALDTQHVILIGHSNGGDMVMLFAEQYPLLAHTVISLDNRRMRIPRTRQPFICSIRSSDQPADKDVLPDSAEQQQYGIRIVYLKNTIHNNMNDNANPSQRKEMLHYIFLFANRRLRS